MNNIKSFEFELGGRKLVFETGRVAEQAAAAITIRYGDTLVLVTASTSTDPKEGVDFLPLTVDYEERLYAAGKIPGGFIRREGRPSQEATLASRLTDRAIRPLLPKTWRRDTQVVITVLSADQENDPDILALIGASAALTMSHVPFDGPVGAIRIGRIDDKFVINPTLQQMEASSFDLVVASAKDKVIMLEAGAKEVPEDLIIEAIKFGHEVNQGIIQLQTQLREALGKPKDEAPVKTSIPELAAAVATVAGEVETALASSTKGERDPRLITLQKKLVETLSATYEEKAIKAAFDDQIRKTVRNTILEKGHRVSGRAITEIRKITCEAGLLPRTHGSALFTRGQTQVLNITTLGSTREEQKLDGLGIEETKRFIHHYNMPPFSNGEVGRVGSPGRREIGHGALAERSLLPVIPKEEDFPYTIRLVSEVLSSSGSTSMASVCASSLSLMDAGVPIKRPVSGIAMGLVTGEDNKFAVLTDIEGMEDNYGDMDFKVAGTTEGITGVQMDTKLKGLTLEIVEKTIHQARDARLFIMDIMKKTIAESRPELSKFAPRVFKITVPVEKIGAVIGPGGKTIRAITEETKTTIDINDDGTVLIGSTDEAGARKAMEIIQNMTREVEVGATYTGKATRILNFGAMIEILPGKEGLVHISELADYRVGSVEDIVKVGDEVKVKVIEIDSMGRINLSRRALLPKPEGAPEGQPSAPAPRPPHRPSHPPFRRPPQSDNKGS